MSIEQDPEFQSLIREPKLPGLETIAALARSRGIKDVSAFWCLFDLVGVKWRENKNFDSFE